ncbi:MAG: hypothetical protein QHH15_08085 [Candidatus Thermoplasmatota archaeon]|jgi:predicted transcriptional regulator|nr:hypothetical protein [Candidatus Thermoplasmatota archaeon]
MDEGFILSNRFRRIIFDGFASGETDLNAIIKKQRIVPNVAKKIIDEFISGGIIEKKGLTYTLTKKGKKIAEILK